MKEINIKPSFLRHCSNVPWIERFEARGWKVSDRVKFNFIEPSTFYCREHDTLMGWGSFDYMKQLADQTGVKVNIYFED